MPSPAIKVRPSGLPRVVPVTPPTRVPAPAITSDSAVEVYVPVPGPPGPAGPPGTSYAHHQQSAAATWIVEHGLGTRPDIILFLDAEPSRPVISDVTHLDDDTVTIELPTPSTGWAYAR